MSVSQNPQFTKMLPLVKKVRDCFDGEDLIKSKGTQYLLPTRAMLQDGFQSKKNNLDCDGVLLCKGQEDYKLYKARAIFPELVADAVENYIGLLHKKDATIEVPEKMQKLLGSMSNWGETAGEFLRRVNFEQLTGGRCGILVDIDPERNEPYATIYPFETIEDWATVSEHGKNKLVYVRLNEDGYVFDMSSKQHNMTTQSRYLQLIDGSYKYSVVKDAAQDPTDSQFSDISLMGKSIDYIGFFFANSTHTRPDVEKPPLLKLANACLSIYNSEADYRKSLHYQGADTLVIKGQRALGVDGDDQAPIRTGAGAAIALENEGDAKYIGVSSLGLAEQREALKKDYESATLMSGQFVGTNKGNNESGDAMKTRIASRTASLLTIALTGASALEDCLRCFADFLGEDRSKVVVTANLDFVKGSFSAQEFIQLVTSRNSGAPISIESLHKYLKDFGITEMDLEQELEKIKKEVPGAIKPIIEQIDKSTGERVGGGDPTPSIAKTNVDQRP